MTAPVPCIRKLLFVLGDQAPLPTAQFSLFLATAAVFVGALVTARKWAPGREP